MKILSKEFIKKFNGKIINIHPSLLPKYKGLNTHKRVLDNQEKFSGCTVHFVSSRLDSGKIILQKKVRVFKKDSLVSLSKRILKQEHILYPKAINKIYIIRSLRLLEGPRPYNLSWVLRRRLMSRNQVSGARVAAQRWQSAT